MMLYSRMSSVTAGLGKQIGSSRFISSSTAALFTSSSFSNSSISNSNPISFSPSLFSSVTPRSSLARLSSPVLNPFSFSVRYFSSELTKVPTLGDSITEGTIVKWSKNVGDSVENDEVIVVIETDKVSVDIRATKGGVLKAQLAKEGDTVQVGADLAEIETGGGGGGGGAQPAATSKSSPAPSTDSSSSSSKDSKSADKSSVRGAQPEQHVFTPPSKEDEAIKSAQKPTQQQQTKASTPATSPSSTPAASSKGKDESSKKASSPSPSSSISPLPSSSGSPSRNSRRVPMSRMRQTIASRLKQAQNTAASLTTFNEIDMTNIMELRNKHKDEFLEKTGIKLGFMSAFVKAATAALQKIPDVNASIEGNDFVYHDYVDISVAVSTPTGLVVPVLRNTETLSFAQIEAAIAALGAKARKNQIAIEDMVGGTFTISNGGVYGSLFGTPILNPPQSAILGMHGIFKRPVVIGDKIEIRPMMYVALTYDHRVIDGGTAVTFLKEIKTGVEDPTRLLLNI